MHRTEMVAEWVEHGPAAHDAVQAAVAYYVEDLGFNALNDRVARPGISDAESLAELAAFFTLERVESILGRELENFAAGPIYTSTFTPIEGKFYSGFVLFQTQSVTTTLIRVDPHQLAQHKVRTPGDQRSITFSGTVSHVKIINGSSLVIRRWRVEQFDDSCDLRTAAPEIAALDPVRLTIGDEVMLDPFEEFEFVEADGPMLLLMSRRSTGPVPVVLEYDVDSLKLVVATAVSQEPTRLQMLSTVLRLFERQDGFEAVQALLDYPQHFVRWHGMREMLALDAQRALPHLLDLMERDPQPSVRRAALATLQAFFPEQLAVAAE